jgi:hypothetical protein
MPQCYYLTPAQLADKLAQGYFVISGPWPTDPICEANCPQPTPSTSIGSGSGSTTGCCSGPCSDPTIPAVITNAMGCWTSAPANQAMTCIPSGGGHYWGYIDPGPACASLPSDIHDVFVHCVDQTPTLSFTNLSGPVDIPASVFTCNPLRATFVVDDGAGNSCKITVG